MILQYRFNEKTGTVTPKQPSAVHVKKDAGPRQLVFDPNGHDVFGVNELDGTVNRYQLNDSGLLKLVFSYSVVQAVRMTLLEVLHFQRSIT
ncbi:beta-propeller fold lactonase family protein [Arcticibacter svalbardensis]|uniref:beta-propeller fold lactonase family protein n=1 Tax=Arcticibacter svalbardensis TaxID=1288027 RepID=UPI0021CDB6A2|nr:beta-propeller fold lactonase family protein [Arcticibacter svalbardensis]